jgi:glycosyltransferase involved in cell wall biosynthesis
VTGVDLSADVSVVILTFNEETNLPAALDSVRGWAREVFVVDSYSTDRTVDIGLEARAEGVVVVQHAFENYSKQWNWALAHLPISAGWVLKLDADERLTGAFKQEVSGLIRTAHDTLEGVYFRRQVVFMGKPLRWGAMTENYDLRMWRTGRAVFEDRPVNEHAVVRGATAQLRSLVEHHTMKSVAHWLDKHNRYSSLEARCLIEGNVTGGITPRLFGKPDQRRMWLRRLYLRAPARSLLYFLYRYVVRFGFLDGRVGFAYCFLHASYFYWLDLKRREHARTGVLPENIWPARGAAHPRVTSARLQEYVEERPAARL